MENLRYGSPRLKQFAAAINRLAHVFQAQSTSVGTVNMFLRSIEGNPYADIAFWDIYAFLKNNAEYYFSHSLTFPRDRLVAISGVAKEMAKAANDQYLAGIWKSKLLFDFLWKVDSHNPESRPRPLRAPTWSWAYIDGGANYILPEYADRATVEVLEAQVSHLSDDAYTEILTGYIRVRCRLYPATLFFEKAPISDRTPSRKFDLNMNVGVGYIASSFDLDHDLTSEDLKFYCMPVLSEQKGDFGLTFWLLLRPSGTTNGHFERIGMFETKDLESRMIFESPWKDEKDLEYEKSLGDGQYIITIV